MITALGECFKTPAIRQNRSVNNIVMGSATSVHANQNSSIPDHLYVLRAGILAPLVTVDDFGFGLDKCLASQHQVCIHCLVQLPTNYVPGIPVQKHCEIHPTLAKLNIGYIRAPDMVCVSRGNIT